MHPKVLVISDFRSFLSTRPEAEIFLGLHRMGFDVHIMTYDEGEYVQRFREAGIPVVGFHPDKKFSGYAKNRIREYLVEFKPHILQLYNSKAIINGLRAARGLPVKTVLYRGFTGNIHWYDPSMYIKYFSPRTDKIICNAKAIEELFCRQWFFDCSKAVTINKGHDLAWYEGVKPIDPEDAFGIPRDAFVVSCVANARKMKDIPTQLRAMSHIPEEIPIHLLLVGRNMDTPEHRRIIQALSLSGRVHFAGYRKDALRIVSASDCFLLTSIHGESITKSVIEAMSLGIPPVITDIPGNRELVEDGVSGRVVPAGEPTAVAEAIMELYDQPEKKKQLGEGARQRIGTRLSTERTVAEYARLYRELAETVHWD